MAKIALELSGPISLKHTFENGQCFRWHARPDGSYRGVVRGDVYDVYAEANTLYIDNAREDERAFFRRYFDADTDYGAIEARLADYDEIMLKAVAYGRGMRILRQDLWEMIISFILSVQKNIPAIKQTIECICQLYGEPLAYDGKTYYSFPRPEQLYLARKEDIMTSKCGFRANGVLDAARKVQTRTIDLDEVIKMDGGMAKAALKKIYGIGDKVADCILLFALGQTDVCPVDTWVQAGLRHFYEIDEKDIVRTAVRAHNLWDNDTGYAQQYLFHYLRNHYTQDKKNKILRLKEKKGV